MDQVDESSNANRVPNRTNIHPTYLLDFRTFRGYSSYQTLGITFEFLINVMCLCLGPPMSGKTLLMKRLQGDEIDEATHTVPTNGTNMFTVKNNDGHFDMVVRELGGSMAPIWKHYYERARRIIFVVDASNLCQISAAGVLLYSLLVEPQLQRIKIALILSKMDLSYRQMRNEALLILQFSRLQREITQKITVIETSAMTGSGIETLRSWIFDSATIRATTAAAARR